MGQHKFAACTGLNGETRRDGQSGVGHLGEARAFAAQLVFHFAVAVGAAVTKEKYPGSLGRLRHKCALKLFHHFMFPSCGPGTKPGSPNRTTWTRRPHLAVRRVTLKP